jgi:Amt family ammonium transporter
MLDGATSAPGGLDGNGIQIGKQFAEITAISAYSFVVSCALLYILKYIPGMHLRVTEEAEMKGLDLDQFFDEQIGDWGMFAELERRKAELQISSPRTTQMQELAEPMVVMEGVERKSVQGSENEVSE